MLSIKNLAKLNQKKYRQKYNLFLIEGTKGVEDALDSKLDIEQILYTKDWLRQNQRLIQSKSSKNVHKQEIDNNQLHYLADSSTPQGVVAVANIPNNDLKSIINNRHPRLSSEARRSGISGSLTITILEDIRDPGNLGTMIRTSDWFGVGAILLIGGADPYQPKVVRSSMGSIGQIPLIISENITQEIQILKDNGFTITTTRPELAKTYPLKPKTSPKQALIFGNESFGTSSHLDSVADTAISIPKFGKAESLNVAISYGIVLYEVTTKQK